MQHLVNPFQFLSWMCLLIVVFGSDAPTSLSVFDLPRCWKGIFLHQGNKLWSSIVIVICDLSGSLVLLRWPVHSFLLKNKPECWTEKCLLCLWLVYLDFSTYCCWPLSVKIYIWSHLYFFNVLNLLWNNKGTGLTCP